MEALGSPRDRAIREGAEAVSETPAEALRPFLVTELIGEGSGRSAQLWESGLGPESREGNKTHHPKLCSSCPPGAQVSLCFWIEGDYIRTAQSVANGLATFGPQTSCGSTEAPERR